MTTSTTRTPIPKPALWSRAASGHFVPKAPEPWGQVPAAPRAAIFIAGKTPENGGSMQFFTSAVTTLQTLVVALGAGLGVWGVVNLLEGYGSDNPGSNAHVR